MARQAPLYAAQDSVNMAEFAEEQFVAEAPEFVAAAPAQGSLTGVLAGLLAVPLAVASFFMLKQKPTRTVDNKMYVNIDDVVTGAKKGAVAAAMIGATAATATPALAYPIFAQQGFKNPREATGRLVCANCHLAQKKTEIEVPQSVLPDQVFEAVAKVPNVRAPVVPNAGSLVAPVSLPRTAETLNDLNGTIVYKNGSPVEYLQKDGIPIAQSVADLGNVPPNTVFKYTIKVPYDQSLKQVGAKGKPADLNVGAVVVLPDGFTLAPEDRIPEKLKEEMAGLTFQQYSDEQPNIFVAGPIPGKQYEEMHLALLSPDPKTNKNVHYGTLPIYVGGNRGRGQVYPSGEKSNNNMYASTVAGTVSDIKEEKRVFTVTITGADGSKTEEVLPVGATLIVDKGDEVAVGQPLTTNPNVGGFGQTEDEIVLQDPSRVQALLLFFGAVLATQTLLVVKKKQYEQVQLSEMNF
jgi:apocytochrome f